MTELKTLTKPQLSAHFQARKPSVIRMAQIAFAERQDPVKAVNLAIGNVSLPAHPAMKARLGRLAAGESPFQDGVIRYTPTVGVEETRRAFLHSIASCGFDTQGLYAQITDGGSQAMELMVLGVCGPAGGDERPLILIEPIYTNYLSMAQRLGRPTLSITRRLGDDGRFSLPDLDTIEELIKRRQPGGLLVIPYDNPTGQLMERETLAALGRLCVDYNLWMVSDEAYRNLYYTAAARESISIWALSDREVPGIQGRRISIETASKVWNACGLRIGALITDNQEFHRQAVAEYTANLCANALGQYLFGALAGQSFQDLAGWYERQRGYYQKMIHTFRDQMIKALPGIIVASPDASIYSVLDVRRLVKPDFDCVDFVMYCATRGKVSLGGEDLTLLVAPLSGFYTTDRQNPGKTQMRVAFVETMETMQKVPRLLKELLEAYEATRR